MVSTLGRKLAPKIPRYFGEVIYATRTVNKEQKYEFNWSTVDNTIDLKNRALPVSSRLRPDFGQVVDAYKRRLTEAGSGTGQK